MKTATRKLRPPVKWHGGKTYLARRIIALFPPHETYVESFVGGGSVLLNKPPAAREVAGDLNAGLVGMWWSLQSPNAEPFIGALNEMTYDEPTFEEAKAWAGSAFGPKRAVGFLVRNRFSRGGLGKDFAWSDRLRGGQPGDVNAWETIRAELPAVAERVKGVEFNCCDAVQLIESNDGPATLHYCDPPYPHETRSVAKAYEHEMGRADHERLLSALLDCKGSVFLSGYPNDLYDSALAGWTRHEFSMPNHSGQGKTKQRRTECLWTNTRDDHPDRPRRPEPPR